ncbi:MAG TPA: hypothetical protein VFZ97_02275 [Acidimicrobiales bacterium]
MRLARARLGAAALLTTAGIVGVVSDVPAFADATAPPAFPTNCPAAQYPPPGYPNPPPATPFLYQGKLYSGQVRYEVPFKAIINGGEIDLPPNVKIPHLYASLCGLIQLPDLSGTIEPNNFNIATPNVYVASLEALPASVAFGQLKSTIDLTPAPNGGLNITISGATTESVSTLSNTITCGLTLTALFTTKHDGILTGAPVTGPTMQGQAEAVSNSFAVPPVQASNSCPPSVAQTFNQLLGLPAAPGVGTFKTPFCFDFELQGINNPTPTAQCPWPS